MMNQAFQKQAVYMVNADLVRGQGADPAIVRGLESSGCQITFAHGIADALGAVFAVRDDSARPPVLVAEVQAGALSLLSFLAHQSWPARAPEDTCARGALRPVPMPIVLFDRDGDDVRNPIRALEHGVRAWLLASDPTIERELTTRLVAEGVMRS